MNEQAARLIELRRLEGKKRNSNSSQIISICSGKGGTGKTFFAANFANQLSLMGKRVLLVDLDLNFSNLNILLNETSSSTISNFFEQSKSLEELVFNYSSNLHLIFGDSGRSDYPRVSREILDYLFFAFSKIQSGYDYIILDSSAGADQITLHQLTRSDFNIMVAAPEPTAVVDAYVMIKLLLETGTDAKKYVIINKCSSTEEGEAAYGNLSMAAKHFMDESIELLGFIGFDSSAHRSIVNQELLLNYDPESVSGKNILEISERFCKYVHLANNNHSLLATTQNRP
jgi:flagellar biosynthesis protein FlhG